MTYKEVKGNLFDYANSAVLVHCISADFALGKGIAKEFDKRYNMRAKLQSSYPGYLSYYNINDIGGSVLMVDNVANLITKERYWMKPTYKTLRESLVQLVAICVTNNISDIAMPLIGCGLDRLEWSKVSKMIQEVFSGININITVVML